MSTDNHWPKLEQAQGLQVDVIIDHPNMNRLAEACGPFFHWMNDHDDTPDSRVTFSADATTFTINGVTYDNPEASSN